MANETFSKGLEGVIAAESRVSKVSGEDGKLYYRGYSIDDLAASCSFVIPGFPSASKLQ